MKSETLFYKQNTAEDNNAEIFFLGKFWEC